MRRTEELLYKATKQSKMQTELIKMCQFFFCPKLSQLVSWLIAACTRSPTAPAHPAHGASRLLMCLGEELALHWVCQNPPGIACQLASAGLLMYLEEERVRPRRLLTAAPNCKCPLTLNCLQACSCTWRRGGCAPCCAPWRVRQAWRAWPGRGSPCSGGLAGARSRRAGGRSHAVHAQQPCAASANC